MVKIETFDATTFWNKSYAHQRGKLLKHVQVPDDQIKILVNQPYLGPPAPLRYEIETSGIKKTEVT